MESQDKRVENWANLKATIHDQHPELPNARAGETVCIAYPHLDSVAACFTESLLRMAAYDKTHGNHLLHNSGLMNTGAVAPVWGRSIELAHARNTATAAFLGSDADWLLWIDTDMGFEQDALEKLLMVADPQSAPVVGGLCFIEGDYSHDFRGGLRSSLAPTLYDWCWVEPKNGMPGAYKLVTRQDWSTEQVTRVGATGTGFLLVHRSVFEKISAWAQEQGAPPHIWFERIPGPDGELCGEDISFCLRVHQVGLPVLVHTGVTTTHQKTVWYGVPDYRMKPFTPPADVARVLPVDEWPKLMINRNAVQDAERDSPIRDRQVPEAAEEVAIIVPVARRDNAQQFLQSLVHSITPAQRDQVSVWVMTDVDDDATWKAWDRASDGCALPNIHLSAKRYLRSMGSFAEKVNQGYRNSSEPWLFLVGDDVRFHPGWLDQAMAVARDSGASVIGTNDLGNPMVQAGEHATHMLIHRDYVVHVGAGWDGPGVVCHEGYRHWFIDNEIVTAAKQRGVWAAAAQSIVEHLHPYFGKGDVDETYRIGQAAAEADGALFQARLTKAVKEES